MSYQDLLRDPDFTRAVKTIAEQCSVNVDIAKLNVKERDLSKAIVWQPPRIAFGSKADIKPLLIDVTLSLNSGPAWRGPRADCFPG